MNQEKEPLVRKGETIHLVKRTTSICDVLSSNTLRRVGKEAERRSWLKLDTKDEVKIVERAGTKLRFLLHKSNPFDGGKIKCNRDKCLICDNPLYRKFNCGLYI